MDNSSIARNLIIEWLDAEGQDAGLSRILWIDDKRTAVAVYMLSGPQTFPIMMEYLEVVHALETQEAVIRPYDPFAAPILDESEISPQYRRHRDRNWKLIEHMVCEEPAVYLKENRGKLVLEAIRKSGTQKKYIYKYLHRYWQRGMTKNALLPDFRNCGGPNTPKPLRGSKRGRPSLQGRNNPEDIGVNVTEVDKSLIKLAISRYYNVSGEFAIRKAYKEMLEKHYNKGYQIQDGVKVPVVAPPEECLTYSQFYYWFNKFLNLEKSLKARTGERAYNLRHRPVLNDSTHFAFGPGHIYQIDSTIADIYLLSSFLRTHIIGRPVLYFVVDVFSRMVVGFYVGLEGPSWIGAAMALAVTAVNKVEFCARFGISIQPAAWPADMFPQKLVADRGPEWIGNASDMLVDNFNITVTNAPPYRADFKGIVERQFHKAKEDLIKWIPGAVTERFGERGERDYRLDATLTLPEFAEILIRMILDYNNNHYLDDYPLLPEMIADGVKPVPIEIWNWGMRNRTGYLQRRSQKEVLLGLMPSGTATVTWQGIHFQGLHYTCDRAIRDNWYVRAKANKSWKSIAYYDPRRLDRIYLLPQGETEPIECRILDKDQRFAGYFLEDLLEQNATQKLQKQEHTHQERQGAAEQKAHIEAVIERAQEQNKLAGDRYESDRGRTKGISENRRVEKALLGVLEGFDPTTDRLQQIDWKSESEDAKSDQSTSSTKKQRVLELLRIQGKGGTTGND